MKQLVKAISGLMLAAIGLGLLGGWLGEGTPGLGQVSQQTLLALGGSLLPVGANLGYEALVPHARPWARWVLMAIVIVVGVGVLQRPM